MELTYRQMGLSDIEYARIKSALGREPSLTELGMYAVLWSEHCAYKHSRELLRTFPTTGEGILVGPGENAGAVEFGDYAIVFKMESHNHPVAIEPFQGAATGVGGIVRDILAMGARPVALLDSLRFGDPREPRNRYLMNGVVAGISAYGNSIGVPTVGGEVKFADAYSENPLCNVMCVGVVKKDRIAKGLARGPGNALMLVGARTGRDGIHGATFASEELDETSEQKRPAVQVGDPFMEKLLIEACLELLDTPYVVGIQDMGAAGITSSVAETASRAKTGAELYLDNVPLRESGMSAYEIMLSESQERMLLIVEKGKEEEVAARCAKWGLESAVIGRVTADGMLRVFHKGEKVAEVPVTSLTDDAPCYSLLPAPRHVTREEVPSVTDADSTLLALLASPGISSKEWVFEQYDHMVQTNTVVRPGQDAAVIRVRGTKAGIALSTDGNGRLVYLDPYEGGKAAVAEAARNVVCVGATPRAITNCLNFGNPEKPHVAYEFTQAVRGMGDACRALGTPVTGGNVSFYNETSGRAVYPTPVVGMLGVLDDITAVVTCAFKSEGDVVLLLGPDTVSFAGSELQYLQYGAPTGMPVPVDLEMERRLQRAVLRLMKKSLVKSAHDLAEGGLAVALAECCIERGLGARVDLGDDRLPLPLLLFGEGPSRIIITCAPEHLNEVRGGCEEAGVPCRVLGTVGQDVLHITRAGKACLRVSVNNIISRWRG
ncbi:MAG: phosphoribosylformylglycinamidine synthase subunit PurL [Bacillota bacterium]